MFQDWQTVAVCLIILAALAYVGRRGWERVRSFRASGGQGQATCSTGCGSCGDEKPAATARPQNALVQITNKRNSSLRQQETKP